jgi:SEC-C motif-containing protein
MTDELCPCSSGAAYADCCGPLLAGKSPAATAEALMRSRYTAYVRNDAAYLLHTLFPRKRAGFDGPALLAWNAQTVWTGLRILATDQGGVGDASGVVEFIASYVRDELPGEIHEVSRFRRKDGHWFYVDGRLDDAPEPVQPAAAGPGRNAPCPCGSGKKFKRCCG